MNKQDEKVLKAFIPGREQKHFRREENEKRTRSAKVFSLGAGEYQAIVYQEAVHYQDRKTGAYYQIDNRLIARKDRQGKTYYQNRDNGDLRVTLHGLDSEKAFVIENDGGQTLKWHIQDAATVQPVPRQPLNGSQQDAFEETAAQLLGEAVYENIFEGTDLVCRVVSNRFKDEFIFKAYQNVRPITFLMEAPGLCAQTDETGETIFTNADGETAFILPAPFMLDGAGGMSRGGVKAEACYKEQEGMYALTYTPDEAWLQNAVFPVTLDPAVITTKSRFAIEDTYSCSEQPSTRHSEDNFLRLTHHSSNWGDCDCFFRFVDEHLPAIDSSYYVTKAYFSFMTDNDAAYPTSTSPVVLREVLADWQPKTLTYNNRPAVSEQVADYVQMEKYGANRRYLFDVSNLVRKWYAGQNYGFRLDATSNTYAQLWASENGREEYRPFVIINYNSLAGLEDYLAYDSQSAGRAGTGSVSLYNGNLIFAHQDTATSGSLMPVSLAHYYNSCYHDLNPFGCGNGWKSSLNLALHKETLSTPTETGGSTDTTYYVYMDGDGTRHHFQYKEGKWGDLSGLEMTLTIADGTATIRDKMDNTMVFPEPTAEFDNNYANVKQATALSDAQGNTITISGGLKFTGVTDGAGRSTSVAWAQHLAEYTAPGMDTGVSFSYDGSARLTQILHEDGETTAYTYNSLGLLETAVNHDGLTVKYEYHTTRAPYRIKMAKVYSGALVVAHNEYAYGDMCTTVTDVLSGKKLYYHFNDHGNLVAVRDELGYGAFAKYSPSLPINHPQAVSKLQKTVTNLLADHSFEGDGWSRNYSGGTGSYAYDTGEKYMGTRSLKMQKTNADGNMHIAQTVECQLGKTYTVSVCARGDSAMRLSFAFSYTDGTGTVQWMGSASFAVTGNWERKSYTFTLPANAYSNSINVCICGVNGPGSLWLDAAQLEEGVVPNRYNLLENNDFNRGFDGWLRSGVSTEANCYVTGASTGARPQGLSGNVLKLHGGGHGTAIAARQEIAQAGPQGDVYVAGGWSFSYTTPRDGSNFRYGLRVTFRRAGTADEWADAPPVEWSEEWSGWHMAVGAVTAPCAYDRIRFYLDYQWNYNYAEFDGLFLHKEEFGESFQYDSKGNLLASKDLASLKDNAVYDAFNNLTEYRQAGRADTVKTLLEYGSTDAEKKKHLLKRSTSPLGVVGEYTYDEKGNPLTSKTSGGGAFMQSGTEYTADRNYAQKRTDARGKSVTSDTDSNLGTLKSITDPAGQKVEYTYDTMKRVQTVKTAADGKTYQNGYTYDKDKLKTVSHNTGSDTANDVTYTFSYDAAGRPTTVQVGNQTLSATAYNANATMNSITYGNNGKVSYTYDGFKRVTGMKVDGDSTDRYTYDYGVHGEISRVTDQLLNRQAVSEYDLANRPMRITHTENGTHLYTGEVAYDGQSNLQSFKEKVGANQTAYETAFAYDNENKPTALQYGSDDNKITYVYDGLGRISQKTTLVNGRVYDTAYAYEEGGYGNGSTTPLVKSITQFERMLNYTYDAVGNITSMEHTPGRMMVKTAEGQQLYVEKWNPNTGAFEADLNMPLFIPPDPQQVSKVSYAYDKLGQLIRANDSKDSTAGENGTTWVYAYDRGGNILSKTAYAYTTGTVGTAVKTDTYTYGDANWKDKLTAYNGTAITYDAIGSPLNDGTWMYTWQAGRQLKSMTKSGTNISYAYNAEGLRVQKTVNGTATNYTLHGKNIVHMVQGSNTLHFHYDAQNRPCMVDFNGVKYGYLHNLQGDIISIVDQNGNAVVEYSYDPWGKPLAKAGSLASTLGTLNPFRYRGYVYDEETGFYATATRYYNPTWGRFINADNMANWDEGCEVNLFSYCMCNPVNRVDAMGNESMVLSQQGLSFSYGQQALDLWNYHARQISEIDGPLFFGEAVSAMAFAAVGVGYAADAGVIAADWVYKAITKRKPVNLPAKSRVTLDMNHIMSGHSAGGNRGGPNKDRFPFWMKAKAIESAIRYAYRYAEKIQTQGERIKLKGPWQNHYIIMWLNKVTKTIESAWPHYRQ